MDEERSIHRVRVRTPSQMVTLPWESAQDFVARCIAAYPTVHPVVDRFRAVGTSRPVDLRRREGRCNLYRLNPDLALGDPLVEEHALWELLRLIDTGDTDEVVAMSARTIRLSPHRRRTA